MINIFKFWVYLTILLLSGIFALDACKKPSINAGGPSAVGTRDELTKDSIYLYAKETYFWNNALPDYQTFNPRGYGNPDSALSAIKRYKLNPQYNLSDPYNRNKYLDKYSFLDDGSLASELGGTGGDYGFSIFYNSESDLRVKYVYDASPAALQGLKRGYQITKVNGRTDLGYNSQANINFVVDAILTGSSNTVTMTVKDFNGNSHEITLIKSNYAINPVLYRNIYPAGSKKVGYLVFNSFTTNASAKLDEAFSYFASNNINELVVDLRYNGGGSVSTAEELINYIAPVSQNGKVMYTTYYNQLMQNGQASILKNQKFRYNGQLVSFFDVDFSIAGNTEHFYKKGNVNVSRVYFIVTGSTASASELVINSLKPVLEVKLIGKRSYGKPVGFFGIRIDKYDMYIPQFQTKNQFNEGDYFDGFAVDKDASDDVTKDFGDISERLLSYALGYSANNTFSISDPGQAKLMSSEKESELTNKFDQNEFKGMIRIKLKPKED